MQTEQAKEHRCPCGCSNYVERPQAIPLGHTHTWIISNAFGGMAGRYCPQCGTRLDPDGTCGPPYAELEKTITDLREELQKALSKLPDGPEEEAMATAHIRAVRAQAHRRRTTHPGAAPGGGVE